MVGRVMLFRGIDRKFKEFGVWVDVGLNQIRSYSLPTNHPVVVCQFIDAKPQLR